MVVSLVQGGEGFIERKEAAVRVLCILKHSFLDVWLRTTREPVRTCVVSLGGVAGMYVCRCVWLRRRRSRGNKKSHFYQSNTFSCEGVIMRIYVGGDVGLLLLLLSSSSLLLCVCAG